MHAAKLDAPAEHPPKILLVDDRPENLFALTTVMRGLEAEIHTAKSGNDALASMLVHEFAVVLLDVQMPGMDGFETASLMHANPATQETPIIFVTAISKEDMYRRRGYEVGAVDYLLKPIDPMVLLSKVKVFLRLARQKVDIERALRDLARLSKRNDLILGCAEEGVLGLDPDCRVIFANGAAERTLGASRGQLVGEPVQFIFAEPGESATLVEELVAGGGHSRGIENRFARRDGSSVPVEFSVGAVSVQHAAGVGGVLVFRDITERKQAQEKLLRMARHDSLTGLGNRALFYEGLRSALARADRTGQVPSVLLIDLDGFKLINDEYGHDAGDAVLVAVSERISEAVRAGDQVCRLGGDEFAVVLEDVGNAENAERVASKIIARIGEGIEHGSRRTPLGASIGIAIYGRSSDTPENLLKMADTAMYSVKRSGRNGVALFSPSMVAGASRRAKVTKALEHAVLHDTITLAYQPQFCAATRTLIGIEALARWTHQELGAVMPDEFIPIAEETRKIGELGSLLMRRSLSEFRRWSVEFGGNCPDRIAVNVSAAQIDRPDFPEEVLAMLAELGLEPSQLEIELTETAVMRHPEESAVCLESLSALGVHLSVDDFGTGYGSLSYLQRFPIDSLKVDRTFIAKIGASQNDDALVTAILGLGHDLGMRTIAEGVETETQAEFLRARGCDVLQGFLLARPLDVDSIENLLREEPAARAPKLVRPKDVRQDLPDPAR